MTRRVHMVETGRWSLCQRRQESIAQLTRDAGKVTCKWCLSHMALAVDRQLSGGVGHASTMWPVAPMTWRILRRARGGRNMTRLCRVVSHKKWPSGDSWTLSGPLCTYRTEFEAPISQHDWLVHWPVGSVTCPTCLGMLRMK